MVDDGWCRWRLMIIDEDEDLLWMMMVDDWFRLMIIDENEDQLSLMMVDWDEGWRWLMHTEVYGEGWWWFIVVIVDEAKCWWSLMRIKVYYKNW